MVVIEEEKCIGCGMCVQDCPAEKIEIRNGKAVYIPKCILCGHCVAVCPCNAISIPEFDMSEVEEYSSDTFTVSPENYLHAVKFRRSIRNYRASLVEQEKLEKILQAGRYTPTAKNRQSVRFIVLQNELEEFRKILWNEIPSLTERMKDELPHYAMMFKLMYRNWKKNQEKDPLFFNAPVCMILASKNQLDAGLAAANMENMAVAEGMGVLYSGYLQRIIEASPLLKKWLDIEELPVGCCMLAGYPAVTYKRTAPRKKADIIWR